MIKIVRIIARLNIGGPARNAVLLTEGFSIRPSASLEQYSSSEVEKIKYETVLVCGEVAESEGDMIYLAAEKGIKPVIVKELGRELSWKDDWTAFCKIYKIIREEKPDIIHTHTAKAGALGRMAGVLCEVIRFSTWPNILRACREDIRPRSNSIVIVHTFHGHAFSGYFGKIKTLFFIWVERFLALFTDKIITVSENLKKELVEKYRIAPENKISVIELGFELEELFKLAPKENADIVNIGIVGRLVPIKNHKMVLDCACNLKQHVRSNDIGSKYSSSGHESISCAQSREVKFIIIGDGELREELEKYAGELGIKDIVEFRGWEKDLKAIYEGLDIVVLTSLNEGTPVSLIEAMAGARPVVATKVGGVVDMVQDGKSGYLVESEDVEEFGRKLMDLIREPEKRRQFGENGRNIVKNRFSKERLIKDTEKLYNTILSK
ncbi:MAG: glycosyltransferase family 4 protein [Candidatus Omnitrophota bacterium]|nr:glycosyltransferase family 4 protein [Candidatus Omnitrophota bacterium]